MPEATFELLSNAGLVSLCLVIFILAKNVERHLGARVVNAIVGLSFGGIAAVMMLTPIHIDDGIQVDLRASMLFLGAFTGGPVAGLICMLIVDATRLAIGGAGAAPAVVAAVLHVGIGLLLRRMWDRGSRRHLAIHLGAATVLLTSVAVVAMFSAGQAAGLEFVRAVLPSYVAVLGLTVLSLGFLLQQQIAHFASLQRMREAHDRAIQADKDKADFLARMTHELRTPLNAILGFSEMIKQGIVGSDVQKYVEYGDDIHRSGMHLLSLVNDVLDVSRLQNGRVELKETRLSLVRIAHDVARTLRPLAAKKALTIELAVNDVAEIVADERALRQIVLNLIGNAIRYAPERSTVTLMAWRDGDEARIGVRDHGPGIAVEKRDKLTEPFGGVDSVWVSTPGQSGLGLPIVHSLATAHGGGLFTTDPDKGPGIIVGVTLPASRIVEPRPALAA